MALCEKVHLLDAVEECDAQRHAAVEERAGMSVETCK
jgi:hypothetical protein